MPSRDLLAIASFELIVFWPIALYFLLVFPDWSFMYLRRSSHVGAGLALVVLLADTTALAAGFVGGVALLRRRQEKWLPYALYAVGGVLLLLLLVARKALFHAGSYAEYHAGFALPLGESKLPWAEVIALLGLAGAGGAVGYTLFTQGRKNALLDTETIQIPREEPEEG